VVPVLNTALADPDGDVRRGVIVALRRIEPNARPSDDLIRAIANDLRDPDPSIRLIAARALSRIGPLAAFVAPDLILLRSDPDPDVRRAIAEALARVTAPPP
jgi:HEAT repeat protein